MIEAGFGSMFLRKQHSPTYCIEKKHRNQKVNKIKAKINMDLTLLTNTLKQPQSKQKMYSKWIQKCKQLQKRLYHVYSLFNSLWNRSLYTKLFDITYQEWKKYAHSRKTWQAPDFFIVILLSTLLKQNLKFKYMFLFSHTHLTMRNNGGFKSNHWFPKR